MQDASTDKNQSRWYIVELEDETSMLTLTDAEKHSTKFNIHLW